MAAADDDGVCPDGHTGRVCDLHFDGEPTDDDGSYYDPVDEDAANTLYSDDASSAEGFLNNSYGFAYSLIQSLCHIEVMEGLDCVWVIVFWSAGFWA
jgi:hypothetical protein